MSRLARNTVRFALPAALVASLAGVASAQSQHFDVNGTTAGSGVTAGGVYSWENAVWQADNAATAGSAPVLGTGATTNWIDGEFARFAAGTDAATNAYTVTANANHSVAGMFVQTNGGNVTVNGTGILTIPGTVYQGFLVNSGRSLTVNSVLAGTGGVQPGSTGSLYLYGVNTYSGGTNLNAATLTYFNNNSSFGTGAINLAYTAGFTPILATGGAPITLANNFTSVTAAAGTVGLNFASSANTPVTSTGTWTLGANNLNVRNNGGSTAPVTLNGVISGTGNIAFSGNTATGLFVLNAVNTYSGTTTVGATSSTNVRLRLGVANAIAASSSLVLAGGSIDPNGLTHTMSSTTLGLTAASAIDFSTGVSELDFANSSALAWTGATLNLIGFDPATDRLRFGTDASGLTTDQLAKITVNGGGAGSATLDANGFVVVPEPASLALLGVAGLTLFRRSRRA